MGRGKLRALLGALATLVVSTAPVSAAAAATTDSTGHHCVVQVRPIESAAPTAEPVCFNTPEEAAAYLSSIGVGGPATRGVAVSTIVGTVYKDYNEGGDSLTLWGSSGCAGATFGFPSLASGWDNSISSVRASNGCWVTLYTTTSYGGSRLNCTPYCASIGTWNDNVKSLVFRPEGTFG
ncbi:peptidase inhibitor family I36 protein [Microbacterium sp. NPDC089189]|uniref:peptidase inhibitor family I36 protein n=1 Tax=Microbacterium sp. NPDC089189 TaxID=3154972 RepID=UPI003419B0FC